MGWRHTDGKIRENSIQNKLDWGIIWDYQALISEVFASLRASLLSGVVNAKVLIQRIFFIRSERKILFKISGTERSAGASAFVSR